jgi:hypothetical protein
VLARPTNTGRMQDGREYLGGVGTSAQLGDAVAISREIAPHHPVGWHESDAARLVRVFVVRALVLALIASLVGQQMLAISLALIGFGLLGAPVGQAPGRWRDAFP